MLTPRRQNRSGVDILSQKKFHMPTAYTILFLLLILVGVVVYVILVLALRTLTREDLEMMPGGKKLAKILHIQ